jgi:hypothetical protein
MFVAHHGLTLLDLFTAIRMVYFPETFNEILGY